MQEFFTPVSKTVLAHREILPDQVLGKQIAIHSQRNGFPELSGCKIALLGVKESRNSIDFIGDFPCFDSIIKSFYSLYAGNWQYKSADLGDITPSETIEDTYFAVKTIVADLLSNKIIPVILGGGQDLIYPVYRAYDNLNKMINLVNFD